MTISNIDPTVRKQLQAICQRVERVQEEIDSLNQDKKEIFAEAKGTGFDVPTLKKVIQRRKKDKSHLQEEDTLLDLYEHAINGMDTRDDEDFLD